MKIASRVGMLLATLWLTACSNISVGVGLPIGRIGGMGVSVGSDGRVGATVGVGTGGATVGASGTTQIPKSPETIASAPKE